MVCNLIANSRFIRLIGEYLHALAMASDITDVVYINYLVPSGRLQPLVPAGLELQRVGDAKNHAIFSVLTYRHGHFGPSCLGRFRRWWPSPIQSNWRIYVTDPATNKSGIHFITTAITNIPLALAACVLSEGVPMHIPAKASMQRDKDGSIQIELQRGKGTSPDLHGTFHLASAHLPDSWKTCFESWNALLAYCVPQDRALAPQPWYDRVARQEISLGIPLTSCLPLAGNVQSGCIESIVGNSEAVCFKVEQVAFGFLRESFDLWPYRA